MTRVLLFGASGFLGRHIRDALQTHPGIRAVSCPGRQRHDLVRGELSALTDLVSAEQPQAVVNCTGRLTGNGYDLVMANTAATAKLIEAVAAAAPQARLVRLGSAGEYGPVAPRRSVREDDPAAPVSEYGLSHLAGTRLVEMASAAGRVDGAVLRVFNPIGAGMHPDNLLGRCAALLREAHATGARAITLGSLTAYRDFVDARDVARAVLAAVLTPTLPHRVFNVASGVAVPARAAVRLLADAAAFTGEIREDGAGPGRSAAVSWMRADISRANSVLGWTPAHDLADSVKAVWTATSE
jgi:nucleoside-diphosphate-sugar epimerase